jgi:Protein of unknown function (DUF3592)
MRVSTLPWELQRSAPRDVRLTAGGRALVILAWLLTAGALSAGAALYAEARRQSNAALEMDRRGVAAPALVDRVWRTNGDDKPAYVAFHFDAKGARIDGESRMQVPVWRELRPGSTVRVRYLPENPRRWAVTGERRNRLPFGVAYVVSLTLAAIALSCAAAVRWQRVLLREGRPARATVTAVTTQQGSHSSQTVMAYEFSLFGGGTRTGKATVTKPPPVGTTISIVYDSDQPKRNRPYPFSFVTVDREF